MSFYTILFYDEYMDRSELPLAFQCWVDDEDHAVEQCIDLEEEKVDVAWIHESADKHDTNDVYMNWIMKS